MRPPIRNFCGCCFEAKPAVGLFGGSLRFGEMHGKPKQDPKDSQWNPKETQENPKRSQVTPKPNSREP